MKAITLAGFGGLAGRLGGLATALLLTILAQGCVKMNVLPTNDEGRIMPLSEPRPFDEAEVQLERDPTQTYRIGPRDMVRVDVRKDPSVTGVYEVTAEGNVLLPNIGPVRVADLTTAEVEVALNEMLAKFIREPEVKVGIQDYRSKVIYVVGQVATPGPQVMRADMLTVEEAIHAAGLPTVEAAMHRTLIVRPDKENPIVYEIDLSDIIYKGRLKENILLRPNDRVYVPTRYSANLRSAIRDVLAPAEEINQALSGNVFFDNNDNNND